MPDIASFVPGSVLAGSLARLIEPRLRALLPETPLSLALIGPGSDVLGYDSARSMDHDWGPRLTIVVPDADVNRVHQMLDHEIDRLLPAEIAGFPTRFSRHEDGTLFADPSGGLHRIEVTSTNHLLRSHLDINSVDEMSAAVWLSTPMQSLLEITAGEVFGDDTGELTAVRRQLAFYPEDVWRYQLSALWMRVAQVQPFIGRAGEVGDDVGSEVIAASIATDLMRIALLQSRAYVPYAKWLGTACARTDVGRTMLPALTQALTGTHWVVREPGINAAGLALIRQLNALGMIDAIPVATEQFHARPFTILPAERIAHALHESLTGTDCENLPAFVGGIDIVTDSTDALKSKVFRAVFRTMLEGKHA